ncbi:cell division protein ZipA [Halomonas elongata]|uniref:cell division protein ZipA n=1 Tax=Halomonas elongata TaxID=2746 RepID=UPI00186B7CA0|nr:cell division protein ZipA [Halomonas elongata]MBW5799317.1 cell division protein ZipA [Halomonas elongata]
MELREWLIILGLALVTLIVIDGVRRLQRQRQVPRLDRAGYEPAAGATADPDEDPEAAAREAELSWELPNGGARVVRPAEQSDVKPKPKLQRQDHPGPSRVLSEFRQQRRDDDEAPAVGGMAAASAASAATMSAAPDANVRSGGGGSGASAMARDDDVTTPPPDVATMPGAHREEREEEEARGERREPEFDIDAGSRAERRADDPAPEPLAADPDDHEAYDDDDRYRLVDLEGMGDSLKSGSKRVGSSMQRFGSSLQKTLAERRDNKRQERARKEQERAERKQREQAEREEQARHDREAAEAQAAREAERRRFEAETAERDDDPLFDDARYDEEAAETVERPREDDVVKAHPVLEKAMRHDVNAEHARQALSHAEEVIVISVMSRDEQGFSGAALLDLMLACGLRYGRDMGIFHRFETEDAESPLQFSMVNVVKPGTFPIHSMDDFHTPGVTLLMPLPSASDTSAAFEAMVETAMVIVRHLGGELKDENMSVMTAQTVEFARQRVQEFERRNRLHRYQVN